MEEECPAGAFSPLRQEPYQQNSRMSIMYKFYWLLPGLYLLFSISLFASGEKLQNDPRKVVFLKKEGSSSHSGVRFYRKDGKTFSLKFNSPNRIGFMKLLFTAPENSRCIFVGIRNERSFRYQDYLLDLNGNGEKRFLIVSNWTGGNSHESIEKGYLIDAKHDFIVLGRIQAGEVVDYKLPGK